MWLGGFVGGNQVVACVCVSDIGVFGEAICARPYLGVFSPTNCSIHQFYSNEFVPLQATFFPGFVLAIFSIWRALPHYLASSYSPFKALCILCICPFISRRLPQINHFFPLWPQHFVNSLTEAVLMLLVHLSCVFEARDYIQSQVYVYIPICKLLIRVFQDVN